MRHSRTGPHGPRSTRRVATALAGVIAVVGAMIMAAPVASAQPSDSPPPTHTVTLTKVWVNPHPGDGVTLWVGSGDGEGDGSSSVSKGGVVTTEPATLGDLQAGDQVSIGEEHRTEGTDLSNYDVTIDCGAVTKLGSGDNISWSFTMPDADVNCTITNIATSVMVHKVWWINGKKYDNPADAAALGFVATPTIDGVEANWDQVYVDDPGAKGSVPFAPDDEVSIGETLTSIPENCRPINETIGLRSPLHAFAQVNGNADTPPPGSHGTGTRTLEAGSNTSEIDNYWKCAFLTLVKNPAGGSAAASAWTLTASTSGEGGSFSISGPSGSPSVTKVAVIPGDYTLTESGGPASYTPNGVNCVNSKTPMYELRGPKPAFDYSSGSNTVSIDMYDDVTCIFTNTYNPPPPPPPSPITVTPAFTVQCVLSGDTSNVTVTTTAVTGISYTVTNNGTSSATVTAAAQPGYALSVPAKWTGNSSSATIVVTAKDATTCVGDESATVVSTTDPSTSTAAVVATTSTSVAVMAASTQVTSLSYTGVKAWQMSRLGPLRDASRA